MCVDARVQQRGVSSVSAVGADSAQGASCKTLKVVRPGQAAPPHRQGPGGPGAPRHVSGPRAKSRVGLATYASFLPFNSNKTRFNGVFGLHSNAAAHNCGPRWQSLARRQHALGAHGARASGDPRFATCLRRQAGRTRRGSVALHTRVSCAAHAVSCAALSCERRDSRSRYMRVAISTVETRAAKRALDAAAAAQAEDDRNTGQGCGRYVHVAGGASSRRRRHRAQTDEEPSREVDNTGRVRWS